MADFTFDRILLAQVMPDVKKHISAEVRKKAWTYKYSDKRHFEFQIPKCEQFPEGVYWYGQANSAYEARYKGWELALRMLGITE